MKSGLFSLILVSFILLEMSLLGLPKQKYAVVQGDDFQEISTPTPDPSRLSLFSNNSDPLRFVFPESIPPPVSAWRPPLYDTPWGLHPSDHFFFIRPIAADEVNWPLWDYRYGGIFPETDIVHTGVDIDATFDTPVIAAASGKVIWSGYGLFSGARNDQDPYGLAVAIQHDFGYQGQHLYTIYAHMNEVMVSTGQIVTAGEQIGKVGDTGKTTGPHLHFEIRLNKNNFFNTYNPELWLSPPQGWGVLAGRVMDRYGILLRSKEISVKSKANGNTWVVRTYGRSVVNSDPYYHENMVLSDLPAGDYLLTFYHQYKHYNLDISILPGRVNFFTFQGSFNYSTDTPPLPGLESLKLPTP